MCKIRQYKRVKLVNEIQSASHYFEFYMDNHGCKHNKINSIYIILSLIGSLY